MLYYLFDYLHTFDLPGAGMFKYITFRSGMALFFSLLISTLIGRRIINRLQKAQIGEVVRNLGLEGQLSKKGTPTMGGIIIIISILIPVLLFAKLDNIYIILMLITTLWLGAIGFADDYIKVFKKDKEGLHGRFKIIGQVSLGLIVGAALYFSPEVVIRSNYEVSRGNFVEKVAFHPEAKKSTETTIPFLKNNNFDYKMLVGFMGKHKKEAACAAFILIAIFIITALSNGANLSDGLDGLAAGSSSIIGVALGILAYMSSHANFASYLNIMQIPGCEELVVFAATFIGATIGFLWYNSYPAQVFMGDTGSLTIGGIIGVFAIMIRKELLLPILCGIFLVESLSVMMQVVYFKFTKKKQGAGKRIFKMTPLHHHFQKTGDGTINALIQRPFRPLPESKIVVRFWLIGIMLAVLTIVTLKIR